MPRRTTWTLACAALSLCALCAIGCAVETNEPEVFYDREAGKCYTEEEDGALREAPCSEVEHPSYETLDIFDPKQGGCTTPADCSRL